MALLLGTASASVTLDTSQFLAGTKQAMGAIDQLGSHGGAGGSTFFDKMSKGALGLGTALIVPMTMGLNAAIDLEQQMANVDAALGDISDTDLSNLADQFNEIAVNSQFSAVEIGAVAEELAKAGIAQGDLAATTQGVVDLSQATGDDLSASLQAVTSATAIWSDGMVDATLVITDFTQVADILTTVANNTRASLTDINSGMRSLAPAAARAGLSYNDAAAAIGFFVDNGLTGADAGVSLTRAISELANPTSDATAALDQLGITAYDTQGNFVGFPTLFDQLNVSMAGLTQQEQEMVLSTIFGAEAIDVMGIAALTGGDDLRALTDATYESGTAAEQSAIRMDTLGAQLGTLKEGINTFLGSLVSGLLPGLRLFVDGANVLIDILMKIPAPIKTVIGAIAGLLAGFASISLAIAGFSALTGFLGMAGIGASIGAVIPVVLGLAAVAGLVYVAWRKNFLGLRTFVSGVMKGITGFIDRFKDAWNGLAGTSDVMSKILGWGGQAAAIVEPINGVSRALMAMSEAVRGIGGGDIPFFNTLADGLDRASGFVDRFKTAWDDLGISSVTDQINQWGGITSDQMGMAERAIAALDVATGGLVTRLREMTGGEILSGLGGMVISLSGWVLDVAAPTVIGWIVTAAGNVWNAVTSAAGWVGTMAGEILSWVLDVAAPTVTGWLSDNVGNIWDALKSATGFVGTLIGDIGSWVLDVAAPTVTGWLTNALGNMWEAIKAASGFVGTMLGTIGAWVLDVATPTVTGWITNAAGNVWEALKAAAGWTWDGIADIGSVTVNIAGWVQGEIGDIWESIKSWVGGGGGAGNPTGMTGGGAAQAVSLDSIAVNILHWTQGEIADLWATVKGWFDGSGGGGGGMEAAPGGMRASEGGGITLGSILVNIEDFVVTVNTSQFWTEVGAALNDLWTVSDESVATFKQKANDFGKLLGSKLIGWIFDGFGGGGGVEAAPGGMRAGGENLDTAALAGVGAFVDGFLNAIGAEIELRIDAKAAEIKDKFKIDLSGMKPDITWPDAPDLGTIPFVTDFVAMIGDISTTISEFNWSFSFPMPDVTWPSDDDLLALVPDGLKKFVTDPVGWLKDQFGSGDEESTPAPAGPPQGGKGKGDRRMADTGTQFDITGMLEAKRIAQETADAMKLAFSTPLDTSGLTSGISAAKDTIVLSMAEIGTSITTGLNAAMQTVAIQAQGVLIGQAYTTGMQQGITTGSATIVAAVTATMAQVSATFTTGMAQSRAAVAAGMAGITASIVSGMATARAATAAGAAAMASSMVSGMAVFRNAVISGMAGAVAAVRSGIAQMVAAASAGRGQMSAAGQGIGAALGQGIAAGIRGQIGAVAAAAASLVTTAVNAARNAGAIRSPSRVMRDEVGYNLALGTQMGILDGLPGIYRASEQMVHVPQIPNRSFGSGSGGGSQSVTTIQVSVNVEGNIAAEDEFGDRISTRLVSAMGDAIERNRLASGMAR